MNIINTLKTNLPKVPGILGKDEFLNSAVLIPILFIENEYYLLFEKRSQNIKQGGEICFPGGRVDEDDLDSVYTALRETKEEIGVPREKITILGKMDTLFGPRGVLVEPIVAHMNIDNLDELIIDESEVEKAFLVPIAFFENNEPEVFKIHSTVEHTSYNSNGEVEDLILPNDYGNDTYYKTIREVLVYKTQGEVIWGITARLVYELIQTLRT